MFGRDYLNISSVIDAGGEDRGSEVGTAQREAEDHCEGQQMGNESGKTPS